MDKKHYLILFILGFGVILLVSIFQPSAGYMDADYYFATGQQLARGEGFKEPFIWNYLDDPQGVPRPSHAYWMPLTSLVAALGMRIANTDGFFAAQIIFIILAGFISPLTAAISEKLSGSRQSATLSGLLAVFSAFYLPFLSTTDTFTLYMVLGAAFTLLILKSKRSLLDGLVLGLLAGLMHLARADGLVWLLIAWLGILLQESTQSNVSRLTFYIPSLALVFTGYLLIMAPWMLRNWQTFGTLLSPGGLKALWFTSYDELFIYPPEGITFARWWASGLREIVQVRLWALGQNLQSALAVQGFIYLAPLIAMGGWHLRRNRGVQVGLLAWLTTLLVMTVAFPFAGARGGFFHSGAALQPFLWALAPIGLERFISWGNRKRGWGYDQARLIFGTAIIGLAIGLSVMILGQRVLGLGGGAQPWGQNHLEYQVLENQLQSLGASQDDLVMVNNPPGYYLASGRLSIVIPDGDPTTLIDVAQRYRASYVILESNHPQGLDDLYQSPAENNNFRLLWSDGKTHFLQALER